MNSNDARVNYTKHMVEETFLSLLREKPVSAITVTEVCAGAGINRSTFYKHYLDIPDLLEKLERQFITKVCGAFGGSAQVKPLLMELLVYLRNDGRRFMVLASDNADPAFSAKIFAACFQQCYPLFQRLLTIHPQGRERMVYDYLSYGSGAILSRWVRDGMADEPEAVTGLIMDLCAGAIQGICGGDGHGIKERY